jgi:hypothetical protein
MKTHFNFKDQTQSFVTDNIVAGESFIWERLASLLNYTQPLIVFSTLLIPLPPTPHTTALLEETAIIFLSTFDEKSIKRNSKLTK